jgi:hypothetical protein
LPAREWRVSAIVHLGKKTETPLTRRERGRTNTLSPATGERVRVRGNVSSFGYVGKISAPRRRRTG